MLSNDAIPFAVVEASSIVTVVPLPVVLAILKMPLNPLRLPTQATAPAFVSIVSFLLVESVVSVIPVPATKDSVTVLDPADRLV